MEDILLGHNEIESFGVYEEDYEVFDAVIRAISLHSCLRGYVETL